MTEYGDRFIARQFHETRGYLAHRHCCTAREGRRRNFMGFAYIQQHEVFPIAPPAGEVVHAYFLDHVELFVVEIRSCMGLEALAYRRLGIRPARKA